MKLIGRDFTNDLTVFMQRGELYLFVLIKEGVLDIQVPIVQLVYQTQVDGYLPRVLCRMGIKCTCAESCFCSWVFVFTNNDNIVSDVLLPSSFYHRTF